MQRSTQSENINIVRYRKLIALPKVIRLATRFSTNTVAAVGRRRTKQPQSFIASPRRTHERAVPLRVQVRGTERGLAFLPSEGPCSCYSATRATRPLITVKRDQRCCRQNGALL
jgi:hypothetical protein